MEVDNECRAEDGKQVTLRQQMRYLSCESEQQLRTKIRVVLRDSSYIFLDAVGTAFHRLSLIRGVEADTGDVGLNKQEETLERILKAASVCLEQMSVSAQ